MYEGYTLVALLIASGIVLLIGEALLPTHGILGVCGGVAIILAVFAAGRQNPWSGLALMVAVAVSIPFVWTAFVKIWPKTPVGRRLILPPVGDKPITLPIQIGQSGVTLSELRPMGLCEFANDLRIEVISDQGIVPANTKVKIIAVANNRPTVRIA